MQARRASLTALSCPILLLLLPSCGGRTSPAPQVDTIKFEEACAYRHLSVPKRQTVVLLDEGGLISATPTEFRAKNPGVIDAILAVGDPKTAVQSGATSPRERFSLVLLPRDGTTARTIFTGCAPALSPEDSKTLSSGTSAVTRAKESYFATGADAEIDDMADRFRTLLLGAIAHTAASMSNSPHPPAQGFGSTTFVQSLHQTSRLADPSYGIARIIVLAPASLKAIPSFPTASAARSAGFAAARSSGLDFGLAEIDIALAPDSARRDYATAFFLGSGGNLVSWSTKSPAALPPPAMSVREFGGTIDYGKATYPIDVRVASDKSGTLVNSWFVVKRQRQEATPLTGSIACSSDGKCTVTSDGAGFAQAWSPKVGGEPTFDPALPFSGLRSVEMTVDGSNSSGRVYDAVVKQVGDVPELWFKLEPH